jgi:hypothetical protein
MHEAGGKPLDGLHVQLHGDAQAPAPSTVTALARLAGIELHPPVALALADGADESVRTPDFILEPPSAPAAVGRLVVPDGTPAEQAHIAVQLSGNRLCAVQAMLLCGLL